ncbi:hypothetical protein MP638_000293, partial [Amoeboaphelidium occidentale]
RMFSLFYENCHLTHSSTTTTKYNNSMGIKGFSAFAKKHQLLSETINLQEFNELYKNHRIFVDLYGSFYDLIRYYVLDDKYEALVTIFSKMSSDLDVTFVIDGSRSAEKHKTHAARDQQRFLKLHSFQDIIHSFDPQNNVSKSKWRSLE